MENNANEIKAGIYRLRTYGSQEPLRYAFWYTFGKSWYLWNFPFYWKVTLGVPFEAAGIYHLLILTLAAYETIRLFLRKQKNFVFLFSVCTLFNLSYLPYFTMSRYSYPIMPMIFVMAGYGVVELITNKKGRVPAVNTPIAIKFKPMA